MTSGQWKESFDKLSEEFIKFQEEMKEEIRILVEDLDSERKRRAQLEIDVDRLKKFRECNTDYICLTYLFLISSILL